MQIRLYGAELVPVEGPRPRATEALLEYIDRTGAVYASHLWHPLFIEGLKTLAFELAEQLDWTSPDAVVCPVGCRQHLAGTVPRLCRFTAGRASQSLAAPHCRPKPNTSSPLYQAFHAGLDVVPPTTSPRSTQAEGIALPRPVRDREVINALRQSEGHRSRRLRRGYRPGPEPVGPGRFLRGAHFGRDLGRPTPSPGLRSDRAGSADCSRTFGSRPEGRPTHRRVVSKRRLNQ